MCIPGIHHQHTDSTDVCVGGCFSCVSLEYIINIQTRPMYVLVCALVVYPSPDTRQIKHVLFATADDASSPSPATSDDGSDKLGKPKKSRCHTCKKKVGLTGRYIFGLEEGWTDR